MVRSVFRQVHTCPEQNQLRRESFFYDLPPPRCNSWAQIFAFPKIRRKPKVECQVTHEGRTATAKHGKSIAYHPTTLRNQLRGRATPDWCQKSTEKVFAPVRKKSDKPKIKIPPENFLPNISDMIRSVFRQVHTCPKWNQLRRESFFYYLPPPQCKSRSQILEFPKI